MGKLTYLRFAYSIVKRDITISILHIGFSVLFCFFLIFGIFLLRMDKVPSNPSSIELFRNYPQLVLLLSSAGLVFMALSRTLLRTADAGIMMAVGGNRIGTIRLLVAELWILHGTGFFLSVFATIVFPPWFGESSSLLDYGKAFLICISLISGTGGIVSVILTFLDPYRSIRRGK
ncbi:ABC transporter permease [Leptospira stimsonii]|uniref:ABC transporter permease n=1 Tax=Leptospira stimsonii TaxID=2202203 RepID=A0A4R9L3L4_9LEPT|nr:ABC transporter permease [Leptospira stimsonii]RHX88639.1 ABC transporter permease [Leptospira stimsonii]RHX93054.1 ABC transporter permease [Leptospira stimsonii]TGK22872.1 ABC transporter permease [Leptospira stimsonii]TGM15043.1 ABC transporter permease [Leptospira stimsonii]